MRNTTDRIEKSVVLRAPRERVWRAITDSAQFGTWFGVEFPDPFAPGKLMRGTLVPTKVDEGVAKSQESFAGMAFELVVDRIDPMSLFSFKWHPHAVDPKKNYSAEEMTTVTFALDDAPGGTRLTITESGFDKIPLARRAEAFRSNDGGWTEEAQLFEKYIHEFSKA
jgi:uncharacterized protein YndB with AHSA1/START domain